MVRIAITEQAFLAYRSTLALGSVGFENPVDEHGERLIWLPNDVVNRLAYLRGPGESLSNVILRVVTETVDGQSGL